MNHHHKKDYYLVTVIGFLVGWLVLVPVKTLGVSLTPLFVAISVFSFTLFAPFALFVLQWLSRWFPVLHQFGKFAAVGTLNSLLDLGVLNFLILITDIASGFHFTLFKTIAFLVAKNNSYLWNKFWTFENKDKVSWREYIKFVFFTSIGMVMNVGVASFIVNGFAPPSGVSDRWWANIGAAAAMLLVTAWNFLTYRKFVFKNK